MKVLIACLLVAGCGGSDGSQGTPGDASSSSDAVGFSDAPPPQSGLLVSWNAMPPLPGMLKPDLFVTSAVFHLSRLQVIGDNGQPMTQSAFDVGWMPSETGPDPDPETIAFPTAPSGLYSQITLDIDAPLVDTCYEIYGTVKIMGTVEMFYIHDRNSLDVDIKNYNITLAPGGTVTAPIKLDLKDAVSSVDFSMLSVENGYRDLDTLDPQMAEFRDKLKDAFKKGP